MILTLLVLMQTILIMELYELNLDLINDKKEKNDESLIALKEEKILCNHCKRTANNGIRCLGICVADSDY